MASSYIRTIEERQGLRISVLEEIAYRNGWINDLELLKLCNEYGQSPYGKYLMELLNK
jgi:glucose-1-phosphate thymidylyltransferase